ncbi:MAG: disulfide bond formation protein B [Motiliproteus sp.]|nr:disulfide bond formation protein B [Motiliproteus sp.]MCW9051847.1 disulfide bond formation protein B [Motiliproteus sp.]
MNYSTEPNGPKYRLLNLFGFMICAASITFAVVYLQGQLGMEPCPLCSAVRLIVVVQGILFLLAFLHNPRQIGQRAYALLGFIVAAAGIAVSGRHIWLQSLPKDQVPECGPGLEYLLDSFPLLDALQIILSGSGECADIQWQLLGLTIPQQSLMMFSVLVVVVFLQFRKRSQRSYFS